MKNRLSTTGFTLVEMLMAIALIVVLFAVVLVAVDPPYRLAQSRNTERWIETREILDAVFLYYADYGELPPGVDSSMKMIGTSGSGCAAICEVEVAYAPGESRFDRYAWLGHELLGIPSALAAPLTGEYPVFESAEVSPLEVRPGDIMTVSARITDDNGVVSVSADMGEIETIELMLVSGSETDGLWQAEWLVHSTLIQAYTTTFEARDTDGLVSTAQVVWTDPPASGWISPTSHNDPNSQWTTETYAYDGNSTTYASNTYGGTGYGEFIELNLDASTLSDRLRVKADYNDGIILGVDIDVYSGGGWVDVFYGGDEATWNGQFVEVTYTQMTIDAVRFRYNYGGGGYYYWLYELEVYENAATVTLPICGSQYATAIQSTAAIIRVEVDDDGGETTSVYFDWGTSLSYGNTTTVETGVASGDLVNRLLSGLTPGTSYYYRANITNSAGTTQCTGEMFTTTVNDVDWLTPTGHSDPSGAWQDELDAYDDTTWTFASDYHAIGDGLTSEYIIFTHDDLAVDSVRWYARGGDEVDSVMVDVFKDSAWETVYDGVVNDLTTMSVTFDEGVVSQVRFRFTTPYTNRGFFWELYEVAIHKSTATSSDECLDITTELAPEYIAEVPIDPKDGTIEQTLYAIRQKDGGAVEVVACNAELSETIINTR